MGKDESRECLFGHLIGKTSFRKKLSLCEVTHAREAPHNKNEVKLAKEIVTFLQAIISQNYLKFANTFYKPEKGVVMGSPTSCTYIGTEIFHQGYDNLILEHTLEATNQYNALHMLAIL